MDGLWHGLRIAIVCLLAAASAVATLACGIAVVTLGPRSDAVRANFDSVIFVAVATRVVHDLGHAFFEGVLCYGVRGGARSELVVWAFQRVLGG